MSGRDGRGLELSGSRHQRWTTAVANSPDKGKWWVVAVTVLQTGTLLLGIPVLQPVLSFVFSLTCPGFVALDLEDEVPDLSARLLVAIAGSLGVNVVVASILLVLGVWSPLLATGIIAVASFAAAFGARSLRSQPPAGARAATESTSW